MLQVVSSVFCVPLRSWPTGDKDKALPSARSMQTAYTVISPDSQHTAPVTFQRQPKVWAISSDSFTHTASPVHGTPGFQLHQSISGYAHMTPLLSTWQAELFAPAKAMDTWSDASSPTVWARSHPTGHLSPRPASRPLSAKKPRGDRTPAASSQQSPSDRSSSFWGSEGPFALAWRRQPPHRRSGSMPHARRA
jgi:hypothetical protein